MDLLNLAHVLPTTKRVDTSEGYIHVPTKAYRNQNWINSSNGKAIRILSEYLEPNQRLTAGKVKETILFFGSARSRSPEEHQHALEKVRKGLADPNVTETERKQLEHRLKALNRSEWMTKYYTATVELAEKLTKWSVDRVQEFGGYQPYMIATGGGPGMMEAANRGAANVKGAVNIGMGISLPFEAGLNQWVTPELGFEFHYFFMRKFMMCMPCRAFVACPGGYGTYDELFEVLTLMQSGKIEFADYMPVVLFGVEFWKSVVNWESLYQYGVIGQKDIDRLFFTDSPDEAFQHITSRLLEYEKVRAAANAAVVADTAKIGTSESVAQFNQLVKESQTMRNSVSDGVSIHEETPSMSLNIQIRNSASIGKLVGLEEDAGEAILPSPSLPLVSGTSPFSFTGTVKTEETSKALQPSASSSSLQRISTSAFLGIDTETPTPSAFSPQYLVTSTTNTVDKKKHPPMVREFSHE